LLAIVSVAVRWQRSTGDSRQQIKWVVFFVVVVLSLHALLFEGGKQFFPAIGQSGLYLVSALIAWVGFPVVIGLAILKYRLYDIDIIIRKTLIYALLTALLALAYLGSVLLLQTLFGRVAGEQSQLIIVLSTLLTAALFGSLRRRVQIAIDRRFFRQRYDAQQVLARFAQTARDEVELDELTAELVRVVEETMRPQGVGLWLKPGGQEPGRA
jgi:hypothetical protein